jgi:histidine transport system permease protein
MIDLLRDYGAALFYWDGVQMSGLAVTLWLLIVSLAFGFVLSVPLAAMRASPSPAMKLPVWLYTYVFRGTPLYIQMLIIYAGLFQLDIVRSTPMLNGFFRDAFNCAILALTLNTTAYTTELFAGAIRAVPHGEVEAARAYGMSRGEIFRHLLLPAAMRRALPGYSNEVIFMLHSTAIAFAITVPELLKVVGGISAATFRPFLAYGTAALIYLATTFLLLGIFRQIERRALAHLR